MVRKQESAMLQHTNIWGGAHHHELINHPAYEPFLIWQTLKRRDRSLQQKLSEIDYSGTILLIGSIASLIIPITWGGVIFSWSDWHTLTPLILGLAGLAVFAFFENKTPKRPILLIILFRNPLTTTAYLLHHVVLGIVNYLTYYLTLYFQAVQGYSTLLAGVTTLLQTLTLIPLRWLLVSSPLEQRNTIEQYSSGGPWLLLAAEFLFSLDCTPL